MTTKVGDLRKGIKNRLSTIDSLHGHVYATMQASPQTPAAAVVPVTRANATMDGIDLYTFAVWVYVNSSDRTRGQTQLDEYISSEGPNSIEAAIELDPTLGGAADSTRVSGWTAYATEDEVGGGKMFAMRLDVECYA